MRSCRLIFLNLWCKQRNVFLHTIQSDNVVITTGFPTGLSVNNTTINGNNVAYYYDDSKAPAANRYTYRPRQPRYAKRRLRY
ncbi:hypothetical protein [Neisseria sp.]